MTRFGKTLSTLLASTALAASAVITASAQENMWFADAHTTAYYNLDQQSYELVARFEAGSKGGNPIVVRRMLDKGAVEQIAVDGTDHNNIRATLVVSRQGDILRATVKTEQVRQQQAGRFYLPAVVGMAYSDPRIATNPAEVRRQGGFATAGAVQWLPAAPATVEAKAETFKLGAL